MHICILERSLKAAILAGECVELLLKNIIMLVSLVRYLQSDDTMSMHTHVTSITYVFSTISM